MARDERYFKDAYQFKPERFLKDNDSNDTKYANISLLLLFDS
jgi:cytochrome P450